ncbi:multicopper oxidase family protein [Streptomyces sp. NPDC058434]|uniref:multicopper oxidase family protein n=1 Tax=Streptomyces sp. NPDC058434 TaxID=3346498 RepID=UPI0036506787
MHALTRRRVLGASIAAVGAGALAACSGSGDQSGSGSRAGSMAGSGSGADPGGRGGGSFVPKGPAGFVNPSDPEVIAAEKARGSGPVRRVKLTATATTLDLGGPRVKSWAYGDTLPGKAIRVTAGDVLDLTLANHLPEATSLHSHGIRLRCDMDGVPGLTQPSISPGADFNYRFAVAHPGTYWVHSHSGMQMDRGLYAPLIVEDPKEPLSYDKEWVVVLDDWVDGVDGSTPDAVLQELRGGKPMTMDTGEETAPVSTGHTPSARSHPSAPAKPSGPSRILQDAGSSRFGGNVGYPHYLVNGRIPTAPSSFRARPGDRIRLRIVNASADTAFRVALGGHEMTVTHTDGYPVQHAATDALLIGMAERYDVLVTAEDGVFPLVALAEGKKATALAVLRTDNGQAPDASVRPPELDGRLVAADELEPHESVALSRREPDRELRLRVTGNMEEFNWGFDNEPYSVDKRHPVRMGERVRLTLVNRTRMWHPIHLHGHTFALAGSDAAGARKDTAPLLPRRELVVDFDADNPGLWMLHCHDQYHSEAGMMTLLGYQK